MFWGTEIFRAHAAGIEERLKAARRAVGTSCDLVPTPKLIWSAEQNDGPPGMY